MRSSCTPIASRDVGTRAVRGFEPPELDEPDRGPKLVESIVEASRDDVVGVSMPAVAGPGERGHAVRAEETDPAGHLVVVRDDHPAFAYRQVLIREEAETPDISERPAHPPVPGCTGCMRGILDHDQLMTTSNVEYGIHVAGVTPVVKDENRLR